MLDSFVKRITIIQMKQVKIANDIDLLKSYLAQDPNNKHRLGMHLGYTSTMAIDQWVRRKKISHLARRQALDFILAAIEQEEE